VVDLHSHILPGLDDGAASLAESMAIAQSSVRDGVELIAATPHVREDYPTTPEEMERCVRQVRAALEERGIALELRPGGEVALDRLPQLEPQELRAFGLAGNPAYLLVEFPYHGWPLDLHERAFRLQAAGTTLVLAHPERNDEVQADPSRLEPVVRAGALVQLTAASVDGRLGRRARAASAALLERDLAHLVASDAHGPLVREAGLAEAARAVGSDRLGRWLCSDVPRAIVEGTPIPPRPAAGGERRPWWARLRRG